jgi:hypothetical protein
MEITENKALTTIQTTSLAQVGESVGAMDKLAQLARAARRELLTDHAGERRRRRSDPRLAQVRNESREPEDSARIPA